MSSNNNQVSPELIVFIAVIAILIEILKFLFLLAVCAALFFAAALTVTAMFAWKKPRLIDGEIVTPEQARGFVFGGLIAAGGSLLGAGVAMMVFGFPASDALIGCVALFGYMFGGLDALDKIAKKATAEPEILPPIPYIPQLPPPPPPPPFRFASWDDEAGQ